MGSGWVLASYVASSSPILPSPPPSLQAAQPLPVRQLRLALWALAVLRPADRRAAQALAGEVAARGVLRGGRLADLSQLCWACATWPPWRWWEWWCEG